MNTKCPVRNVGNETGCIQNKHKVQEPLWNQSNGLFAENHMQDKNQVNKVIIIEVKWLPEEIKVIHKNGATHKQGQDTQHGV
jgi:hypothetical protein